MLIPDDTQRQLIVGRTGSGKTVFGQYVLSQRSITDIPWVVLDFKRDELINSIPHATHLDGLVLPKKLPPGIWIAHPDVDDYDELESLMLDIHRRGKTGLYVDEVLSISSPPHKSYRKLLTQGRSLETPVMSLTQRPVDIDRYAFSESEFLHVFKLSDTRDIKTVKEQKGVELDMKVLPKHYHYKYYDPEDKLTMVSPSPPPDKILEIFDSRLKKPTSHVL